jgi:bifunctional DNA-binding transcriptional regulator/antitoxin component of YhaV-PrlF toxin-antitoxin module
MSVGLQIAGEIRDITLCQFLVRQKLQREREYRHEQWLRGSLFVLAAARQFGVLPLMAATVPYLVLWRGSAALDICFNVVAVLFMLDLDNELYSFWIPEHTRQKMEAEEGEMMIIEVNQGEKKLLSITKRVHSALITLSIVTGVAVGGLWTGNRWLVGVWPLVAFWIAAAIEVWVRVSTRSKASVHRPRRSGIGGTTSDMLSAPGPNLSNHTPPVALDDGFELLKDPCTNSVCFAVMESCVGMLWIFTVLRIMMSSGWIY